MYSALGQKISIGGYAFSGFHSVKIKRSTRALAATAVIAVPQMARVKTENKVVSTVDLARIIKPGMDVSINLGYDGRLHNEFKGFVKQANYNRPFEIECEDNAWLLRHVPVAQSFTNTNLEMVLQSVLNGVVKLSADCDNIAIEKLRIDDGRGGTITALQALEKIKDTYGIAIYFEPSGALFAGLYYKQKKGDVLYKLGYNTIKDEDLKFHRADDVKVRIKAISIDAAGVRTEVESGAKDGAIRTLYFSGIKDKKELERLAQNELKRYAFDGFDGKIKTFLEPFVAPGYTAKISDPNFNDARNGNYYVEGVETEITLNGGCRRTVEIGIKV